MDLCIDLRLMSTPCWPLCLTTFNETPSFPPCAGTPFAETMDGGSDSGAVWDAATANRA